MTVEELARVGFSFSTQGSEHGKGSTQLRVLVGNNGGVLDLEKRGAWKGDHCPNEIAGSVYRVSLNPRAAGTPDWLFSATQSSSPPFVSVERQTSAKASAIRC